MNTRRLSVLTSVLVLLVPLASATRAAIPEPDHTFYGHAFVDGAPLFVGAITVTLEDSPLVLASFTMPPAPSLDTLYVLRVPLDSREPRLPGVARPGDAVRFFINGAPAGKGVVGERGEAQARDLDTADTGDGPTISIRDVALFEGSSDSSFVLAVDLDPAPVAELTVRYETVAVAGGATEGDDYVPTSGTLTIAADTGSTTIGVTVHGDAVAEPDESFLVRLSLPSAGTLGRAEAVATILDDDGPPRMTINDLVIAEGDAGTRNATFAVRLSRPIGDPVTVAYLSKDQTATAGSDYDAVAGTLVFAPGEIGKTIDVAIRGDTDDAESDETFLMQLSAPAGAELVDGEGLATIVDDEQFLTWLEAERNGVGGVAGLDSAVAVAVTPDGKHVYAAGQLDNAIAIFSRQQPSDPNPGQLTYRSVVRDETGQGFVQLRGVSGLAVSPDGAHLYAACGTSDTVTSFRRDAATGALTLLQVKKDGQDGVDGLDGAVSVVVSPDGKSVYAAGTADRGIAVFDRVADAQNADYGKLTWLESKKDEVDGVDGLAGVAALTISSDGAHVYAASQFDAAVTVFARIDEQGADFGKLIFVETLKDWDSENYGLAGSRSVAASSDGRHVYVAGQYDNAITVFARDADPGSANFGKLTFVETDAGVEGLDAVSAVVVDPQGRFVYATGFQEDAVSAFARDPGTGSLSYIETRRNGEDEVEGIARPTAIAVSPTGLDIYVTGGQDDAVALFARDCAEGDDPAVCDRCASDPAKTRPGVCGCGTADDDRDADGIVDCVDDCVDLDGDGFGAPGRTSCAGGLPADCNDGAPAIHPGVVDVCNGLDDDCDGLLDGDALGEDTDADGVHNACDNCRTVANPNQRDLDGDGIGNLCDNCAFDPNPTQADVDLDLSGDACDNCPAVANLDQADADGDQTGDLCDNCPSAANANQSDLDLDGQGDACDPCTDPDMDGFGSPGYASGTCAIDNCPLVANEEQTDIDHDGVGDACDICVERANAAQEDGDHDGIGDVCDPCPALSDGEPDADMDCVRDAQDNCPGVVNYDQTDADGDLFGDACDTCPAIPDPAQHDLDGDRVGDLCDNCLTDANSSQSDCDDDGDGDACDLSDGLIWVSFESKHLAGWDQEAGFGRWNLYRGDLDALRQSCSASACDYTPSSLCGLTSTGAPDTAPPAAGSVRFFLVGGVREDGSESSLGTDSAGNPRTGPARCP